MDTLPVTRQAAVESMQAVLYVNQVARCYRLTLCQRSLNYRETVSRSMHFISLLFIQLLANPNDPKPQQEIKLLSEIKGITFCRLWRCL